MVVGGCVCVCILMLGIQNLMKKYRRVRGWSNGSEWHKNASRHTWQSAMHRVPPVAGSITTVCVCWGGGGGWIGCM